MGAQLPLSPVSWTRCSDSLSADSSPVMTCQERLSSGAAVPVHACRTGVTSWPVWRSPGQNILSKTYQRTRNTAVCRVVTTWTAYLLTDCIFGCIGCCHRDVFSISMVVVSVLLFVNDIIVVLLIIFVSTDSGTLM